MIKHKSEMAIYLRMVWTKQVHVTKGWRLSSFWFELEHLLSKGKTRNYLCSKLFVSLSLISLYQVLILSVYHLYLSLSLQFWKWTTLRNLYVEKYQKVFIILIAENNFFIIENSYIVRCSKNQHGSLKQRL